MGRWKIKLLIFLAIFLSTAKLPASPVEEAARSEGRVVFYSSLNNEQIKTLTEAFRKKYPYIQPSFYRATSERVMQRIITEAQAGRHTADVVSAAGFQIQLIKEKGLTARFIPEESSFYDEGFKDPDGHWISVHSLLNSMGYNTEWVPPGESPKRYEDLLRPKWKGKIGVNLRDVEWYVNLQRRMGKQKAEDFLKSLAAQNPGLREGHSLLAQLLAAGEFHVVANSYAHILARLKEYGAPVQWVFDEPVITYVHPITLARQASHPNAGELFIRFVLSEEGQTLLRDQGRIPSHRQVGSKVFDLKEVNLFPSDPRLAEDYAVTAKEMRAILGAK